MALIKCKECGQPVSKRARKCPHCGRPDPAYSNKMRVITKCLAGLIVLLFLAPLFIFLFA